MPKYRLRMITLDDYVAENLGIERAEQGWWWQPADVDLPLQDGPTSSRLIVVDYDPAGGVAPAAAKLLSGRRNGIIEFDLRGADGADARETALRQVSLFSTVLKTLDLFETPRALGRNISWAFGAEPLALHARCHRGGSPSYSRANKEIRFPFYVARAQSDKLIYTSGSPDIVAHETAHAIVDAILPELYGSIDPQGLALHEALADLTAVFMSFKMNKPREHILESNDGNLHEENPFGQIAERFGKEFFKDRSQNHLRSLFSDVSLNDDWGSRLADETGPHDLSVVMSAAVFDAMLTQFEREKTLEDRHTGKPVSSGKALAIASDKVRRIVFRALDVLPASSALTFRDLAIAMVKVDAYAFPQVKDADIRIALQTAFERRGIWAEQASELDDFVDPELFRDEDVEALSRSASSTQAFVEAHRNALRVPRSASVSTRWLVQKQRITTESRLKNVRHYTLKIAWTDHEPFQTTDGMYELASRRGTTVMINGATKKIVIQSTNSLSDAPLEAAFRERRRAVSHHFVLGLIERRQAEGDLRLADLTQDAQSKVITVESVATLLVSSKSLHGDQ